MEFERSIYDLQARCSRIEQMISRIEDQISSFCKSALHCNEFEARTIESQSAFRECLEDEKKNLQIFKTDVSNAFRKVEEDVYSIINSLQHSSNEIQFLKKEIYSCKEKDEIIANQTNATFSSFREDFRRETKEAIDAIPSPKFPTHEEIAKAIEHKLEPVSLDAKNGVLRSSHCDLKIQIMEKKIEQLFLLIQKHSLKV